MKDFTKILLPIAFFSVLTLAELLLLIFLVIQTSIKVYGNAAASTQHQKRQGGP